MSKFKKGEKIYSNKLGMWGVIDFSCFAGITANMENGENETFSHEEVEKFIEPKFKVGDKFEGRSLKDMSTVTIEIVKISLNKKLKEYSYLAFDVETGESYCLEDSDLLGFKKVEKTKVVNFTIKEVEVKMNEILKNMGRDIIIKIKK